MNPAAPRAGVERAPLRARVEHAPLRVVVMGVCGCGKSTVGQALAGVLSCEFVEGDALHPPDNVRKMAAGIALDDDDRAPWLDALGRRLAAARAEERGLVVACSALKRRYRDRLRAACPDLRLVHLHGPPELLAQRLSTRQGHYMPASLLPSQLATLEPPQADERAIALDIATGPDALAAAALQGLQENA